MTKKSSQRFEYLENQKAFTMKSKSTIHHFKGLSLKQIIIFFLETESATIMLILFEYVTLINNYN